MMALRAQAPGLERSVFRTRRELVAYGTQAAACLAAEGFAVDLLVPSQAWVEARKLALMEAGAGGAGVSTYANWLSGLWDTFGDGRRVVTAQQRAALARPLVAEALGSSPSPALVADFCAFLEELPSGATAEGLSGTDLRLFAMAQRYRAQLEERGLVEPADAEAELLASGVSGNAVVVEEPDARQAHAVRFLEGLAAHVPVLLLQRGIVACPGARSEQAAELKELASVLFTGTGGLQPRGAVVAAEVHGAHIEGQVLAELLERLRGTGTYTGMSVVFANAADSYPHVQAALAQAGVPFECAFSVPSKRTPFGAAFLQLVYLRGEVEEERAYRALSALAASPYSGVSGRDARALQARWRMRATSTHAARMADISEGFSQGNADARTMRERLEPLATLLAAPLEEAVRSMFAHARAARGTTSQSLVDDARAADVLLDYLEEVNALGLSPSLEDMGQLPVRLERCAGAEGDAVTLVDAAGFGLEKPRVAVLANLDALHHPMASSPSAFDQLLGKFGIERPDLQAMHERCLLLDVLDASQERFAFYRVCHDKEGVESCQSALWDELVTAYRTPEDGGRALSALPEALVSAGCTLARAEAQLFETSGNVHPVTVSRGVLDEAAMPEHLVRRVGGEAIPFSPTGMEDYYRCPYRWFASRRVGYNGMDNSFTASARGNLAHAFFDAFYRELHARGEKRVTRGNLADALALGRELFDAQVEKGLDSPRSGLFLRSERDRLACEETREQVLAFIERDADFLPGFAPAFLELELGRGTERTLEYAGVAVRGKVDRIDVDAQGRAVVVDYKLSSLNAGYGLGRGPELPQRIQTDIYATLVQRHFQMLGQELRVVGSVYRSYSNNMLRGVYEEGLDWGPEEGALPKRDALPNAAMSLSYAAYLDKVEAELAGCMERLSAGCIQPHPLAAGVCEYCRALAFCPRREA